MLFWDIDIECRIKCRYIHHWSFTDSQPWIEENIVLLCLPQPPTVASRKRCHILIHGQVGDGVDHVTGGIRISILQVTTSQRSLCSGPVSRHVSYPVGDQQAGHTVHVNKDAHSRTPTTQPTGFGSGSGDQQRSTYVSMPVTNGHGEPPHLPPKKTINMGRRNGSCIGEGEGEGEDDPPRGNMTPTVEGMGWGS